MPSDIAVGCRFGRWTVLEKRSNSKWLCKCDCGTEREVFGYNLKSGDSQSCGCYRHELCIQRGSLKGLSRHPLYFAWRTMIARCENKKNISYPLYGEKGIFVCSEWRHNFMNYYNWCMSQGWHEGCKLSVDRIDGNGPYSPENCRLVNSSTQARNRPSNHIVEFNGETHLLCEWSEITGLKLHTIAARLRSGWSVEDALTKPVRKSKRWHN